MMWTNMRTMGGVADPFEPLDRMAREMDRLLGGFAVRRGFPAMNLSAGEGEAVLVAEVPGVAREDIKLTVEDGVLTVEVERRAEPVSEKDVVHRAERVTGRFARSVHLPFEVEAEKIAAKVENGLLTVTLPRREATKPRRIEIAAGS